MTKDELNAAIGKIGCSGVQLSRWLGVSQVTVSRWRTGMQNIPDSAALAVKALADGWRP